MPPRKAKRRAKISSKRAPAAPPRAGKKATGKKVTNKRTATSAQPAKATAKKVTAKKATAKKTTVSKAGAKKTAARAKAAVPGLSKKATPARDARQALTQKRAIAAALAPAADGKAIVDAYMREVDHPFKAEMQAVREIILGVSPKISERIKWNAPSFYVQEDLGAFNPRATEYAHLILLFPGGQGLEEPNGILEGKHKDRREVKFYGMDDVKKKKAALEKIVKGWVALRG